jgi:hypothetical protein
MDFKEKKINFYTTTGKAEILNLQKEYLIW